MLGIFRCHQIFDFIIRRLLVASLLINTDDLESLSIPVQQLFTLVMKANF